MSGFRVDRSEIIQHYKKNPQELKKVTPSRRQKKLTEALDKFEDRQLERWVNSMMEIGG